jgi:hypothetical protein
MVHFHYCESQSDSSVNGRKAARLSEADLPGPRSASASRLAVIAFARGITALGQTGISCPHTGPEEKASADVRKDSLDFSYGNEAFNRIIGLHYCCT